MKLRKVVMTGSRDWTEFTAIWSAINRELTEAMNRDEELLIIHGDCPTGADHLVEKICRECGVHTARVAARFESLGKKGGPLRNRVMAAMEPVAAYAFPLGESRGTNNCIVALKAIGVEPAVVAAAERIKNG